LFLEAVEGDGIEFGGGLGRGDELLLVEDGGGGETGGGG